MRLARVWRVFKRRERVRWSFRMRGDGIQRAGREGQIRSLF